MKSNMKIIESVVRIKNQKRERERDFISELDYDLKKNY